MRFGSFLDAVKEFFGGDKLVDVAQVRLDRGVLDVAMMISAIDGEILPAEIGAYNRLLGECREASKADVPAATEAVMRKVGFLTSLKQSGISDRECIVSLVREAAAQLPEDFAARPVADRRKAVVFWTMMALSDGTYSSLEHAAVRALADRFAGELGEEFLAQAERLVKELADPAKKAQARSALADLLG